MEDNWNPLPKLKKDRSIVHIDELNQILTLGSGESITSEEYINRKDKIDRANMAYNDLLIEMAAGMHGPVTMAIVI